MDKKITIEEKLKNLNDLVSHLENDKMTLKESLDLYEKAMTISKDIEKELNEAIDKVKIIQEQKYE